ncbi:MAG: hypothetical protein A2Z02_00495 [Chloroflexi bacterium RBG_16_48_7]|nr:MAG: hypothetical protein A2Z02_00495 [Chloroflexi bacterium RBG_16_48_7]
MMGFPFAGMGIWMIFGSILFILFWGGIIWLIVWAVRKGTVQNSVSANQNALDVARARYARGEINSDQFAQIKKDLS